ncbi:MAG: hypothetical protein OXI67_02855 [Candidatus Poribacteria bacterium]|nr:hypothetical protein [Candidatus Poribacteria bacterium]
MPRTDYTSEVVAVRGKEIYQQQIRDKVELKHKGKFLSVDIETGDYEIDTDDLSPTMRLLAKRPDAVVFSLRIGFQAAHRIDFKISDQQNDCWVH